MGGGKTEWALAEMRRNPEKSYIFCTPFLKEFERLDATGLDFREPQPIDGRKLFGFNKLLLDGANIAVTHTTFSNADADTIEYIKQGNYTLFLDEVLDILVDFNDVSVEKIKRDDINLLIHEHFIEVDTYGKVTWCKGSYPQSKYADVERLAKNGNLFYLDKTLLVWQFPPQIFDLFEKVYILTYMFDGSFLKPYFRYHDISYDMRSVEKDADDNYILTQYKRDVERQKAYAGLIDIYDNTAANSYKSSSLSKTWYDRATKKDLTILKNNIYNYLHNVAKAKAVNILWTCPKKYKSDIKGKGYVVTRQPTVEERQLPKKDFDKLTDRLQCFIPCNARATNDFRDRSVLVYAMNSFPNPYVKRYFENKNDADGTNIDVDADAYALSVMLQWIFRSCIRDGEPIKIYIPSTRMRKLLLDWLHGVR